MRVAMLGADYNYAALPAYAGSNSYVRDYSYLGAGLTMPNMQDVDARAQAAAGTTTTAPAEDKKWYETGAQLVNQGLDVVSAWLDRDAERARTSAEIARNETARKALASGMNPFAGMNLPASNYTPLIIAGGLAILAVVALTSKKRIAR